MDFTLSASNSKNDATVKKTKEDYERFVKTNFVYLTGKKSYQELDENNSIGYAKKLDFHPTNQGNSEFIKHAYLVVKLPALTGFSGGSGTYVRYCNDVLLRLFERLRLYSGSTLLYDVLPQDIIDHVIPHINPDHFLKWSKDVGHENNLTQRNTDAESVRNLCIDLKYIFDIFSKPFPRFLLENQDSALRIELQTVSSQDKIIQTDYTTRPVITPTSIKMEIVYQNNPAAASYYYKSGIPYLKYTHDYEREDVELSQVDNEIQVDNFRDKAIVDIKFTVRDTADLTTSYATLYDEDRKAVTSFQLKNGSNFLFVKQDAITDIQYRNFILPGYKLLNEQEVYDKNTYMLYFGEASKAENHESDKIPTNLLNTKPYQNLKLSVQLVDVSTAKNIYISAVKARHIGITGKKLKFID